MAASDAADQAKAQGNEHFKAGEYLKAAASYTKAIKAQPENHVLYSNRAQAFLKLNKVVKALEDSERCITLAPDFVKGYHRKASALHAMGESAKSEEAVQVLLGAMEAGIDDKELVRLGVQIRGRAFVQLVDKQRKGTTPTEDAAAAPAAACPSAAPAAAAPAPAAAAAAPAPAADTAAKAGAATGSDGKVSPAAPQKPPPPLWQLDPEAFAVSMIQWALQEFVQQGTIPTVCYLQPAAPAIPTDEPAVGHINIKPAFESPETLLNCAEFLKQQASSNRSPAAAIVVRKSAIGYPRTWNGKSKEQWGFGDKEDGVFMQLESAKVRMMFFTVLKDGKKKRSVGDTVPLDIEQFGFFPRLFT